MRKRMTTVLATAMAVAVYGLTAGIQCAAADLATEAEPATAAALVVVEVGDGASTNADTTPGNVAVWYRQVRAVRSRYDPPGWGDDIIGVGVDKDGKSFPVKDFIVRLGDFPTHKRNVALVVPRHDPKLEQFGDSSVGIFRDCLVFMVGQQTKATVFLSGEHRDHESELFVARFPPRNLKVRPRKGLEQHVNTECGGSEESVDRQPEGRVVVNGVPFLIHVAPVNVTIPDVDPSKSQSNFAVVDVRQAGTGSGSSPLNTLIAQCASPQSSSTPLFVVCKTSDLPVLEANPDALAILGSTGQLVGVVMRERTAGMLRLRGDGGLRSRPLRGELGRRLRASDLALTMASGEGSVPLALFGSPGALHVVSPDWARAKDIHIERVGQLAPFDLQLDDLDGGRLGVAASASAPRLSVIHADIQIGVSEIHDQIGTKLLDWALGERGEIPLHLPFAQPHSVIPRLSADAREITLDLSDVRWNVVKLTARVAPGKSDVPTWGWELWRGNRRVAFPDGFASSRSVADLLEGSDAATVSVRPAGRRFVGFRIDDLQLSRDDLEATRLLTLRAVAKPIALPLTPDVLVGAAPALRLWRSDGASIDVLGEVDRFGSEGGRIVSPDGTEFSRLVVQAPNIASIEPLGVGAIGPRELTPSALETFIRAVEEPDQERRCKLLRQIMFGQGASRVVARTATPNTVVIARRRTSTGRTEFAALADSALSRRFRVLSGWTPKDAELLSDGKWIPAVECREIEAKVSSTLYLLVVVDQFALGSVRTTRSRPSETTSDEDDPLAVLNKFDSDDTRDRDHSETAGDSPRATLEALIDVWSPSADALRKLLVDAGISTVVAVAAEIKNRRRVFSVVGQVDDISQKKNVVPFRGLLRGFVDGSIRTTSHRLDEHPRQIRIAFEVALAETLEPFSHLIVLNRPRTSNSQSEGARVSTFGEPALMKMRAIDGFLNPGARLIDAFDNALADDG